MDLTTSIQEGSTVTTTTAQEQSRIMGGTGIATTLSLSPGHMQSHPLHLPPNQYQFQQHQSQTPFSHVLASPTVSSSLECTSPLGGTPEGPSVFLGKLTASTSFSGSTRSGSLSSHKQPLQDSEDSSYDSDCEVSDGTSHNDVSRTVSDTLSQEFAEYITIKDPPVGVACGTKQVEAFQFNTEDPNYKSKLEFAKKLGYTETQVQIVLSKLGPNPSQNELLNELILLNDDSGLNEIISTTETGESGSPTGAAPGGVTRTSGAPPTQSSNNLRHIVIDGSNVAMCHGKNKMFSCRGIKIAVDYFKARGHKKITVFVPSYRKESSKPDDPITDQHILTELEEEGILVYTPSRVLNNRRLTCYDDRYILKLAVQEDGIVVSNDNYRDLTTESLDFKRIVEERLLIYSFVCDRFEPPDDPLGRNGPKLDQLLSKSIVTQLPPPCPYGRKCTFGQKCKYYHSTQAKSVSETLRKQAMKTQSVPIAPSGSQAPVCRTRSAIVPMESSKDLSIPSMGGANPHRKLQRQLSINPGGDPRIHQTFQRGASLNSATPSPHHLHLQHHHSLFPPQDSYSLSPFPGNPTLSEVWKPADWSLPGTSRTPGSQTQDDWMKSQRTHLPGAVAATVVPPQPVPPQQQPQQGTPSIPLPHIATSTSSIASPGTNNNPNRTTMYYHLAAIFPEHQVEYVMSLFPDCNDPSFICRQIVSRYR